MAAPLAENVLHCTDWAARLDAARAVAHAHGSNVVEAQIKNLRDKLGARAFWIETVRGVGYRLAPSTDDQAESRKAQQASVQIQLRTPLAATEHVLGRTPELARALRNLIDNAIAHSEPHQHVQVECWLAGDQVCIAVMDCGPGRVHASCCACHLRAKPTSTDYTVQL